MRSVECVLTMLALFLTLAALAGGEARLADRVELEGGSVLEGRIVYEDDKQVVLRVGTKDREIDRKTVKNTYSRAENQFEALGRWIALPATDIRGTLGLAQFCQRHDLLEEMRLFALWVVLANPNDEEAHLYLGHEKTKNGWLAREGGRKVEFDKTLKLHADWGDAWELETTHYALKTNLPLRDAVATALSLECHYHAFFEEFRREVHMFEVTDRMLANVHADDHSFSRLAGNRSAYFNLSTHTLEVDASAGSETWMLMHEATHGLLYATAVATRTSTGDIPMWLNEGLAEYMAGGIAGEAGKLHFAPNAPYLPHFQTHAKAKKPYDLSRLLNFEAADFAASSRADLKYAQAYTLVQFGLHAENGAYRERFTGFMRGAYAGQSSQTHFKEALGLDDAKIERAWIDYVKTQAN